MAFTTSLSITLELTVRGKTQTVCAGNIKNLHLDYRSDGFEASLDYWFVCLRDPAEDTLLVPFMSADPMTAKLTVDRTFDTVGESAEPLVVVGLVTHKAFEERAFEALASAPILHRHYHLSFADRGQVLWRQHFPTALYVDKTVKALLSDHLPEGVTLSASGSAVEASHKVLALGLGVPESQASFYDFLAWWLDREACDLYCDASAAKYEIASSKKSLGGAAVELLAADVAELEGYFPASERATVTVQTGAAEANTKTKDVACAEASSGVRRNYLIGSELEAELDARASREKRRHAQPLGELRARFARYPSVTMRPAQLMKLGQGFSDKLHQHGQTLRLCRLSIEARASSQQATDGDGDHESEYECEVTAELEQKSDTRQRARAYRVPRYPFLVEGRVVSEQGEAGEATHQAYPDQSTSRESFRVEVPLFAKQRVVVPYVTHTLLGSFYLPAYRDARVLLALSFDHASVAGFIDFREGAVRTSGQQGETLQLGKKTSDGTSIAHIYEDAQPVFEIVRLSTKDRQSVTLRDGTMLLSTREES